MNLSFDPYKYMIFFLIETALKFLDKPESNIITAYEKESVTFNVKVSQDTATLQWLKEFKRLTGDRIHTRSEGNTHFLTITNLQRSDSGRYTCDASTDQMHFNLTVKGKDIHYIIQCISLIFCTVFANRCIQIRCQWFQTKSGLLLLQIKLQRKKKSHADFKRNHCTNSWRTEQQQCFFKAFF